MKNNSVCIIILFCISHIIFSKVLYGMEANDAKPIEKFLSMRSPLSVSPVPPMRVHSLALPANKNEKIIVENLKNITLICIINGYKPLPIRKFVGMLSRLNKEMQKYYARESTRKKMIRTIARNGNYSDLTVAEECHYEKIINKIKTLFYIAKSDEKQFCPADLKDKWYLNATKTGSIGKNVMLLTLLHVTAAACKVEETKILMKAGCSCKFKRCSSPIAILAGPDPAAHDYYRLACEAQEKHFSLYKLFVRKKVDPDDRCAITSFTYLHQVVNKGDKKRARVLLEFGAHPYKLFFDVLRYKKYNRDGDEKINKVKGYSINTLYDKKDNSKEPWIHNAFTLEQGKPKGWLQEMYEEIQKKIVMKYAYARPENYKKELENMQRAFCR